MRARDWMFLAGSIVGAGTAVAAYGALVESKQLVLERRTLRLKGWPESHRGYRIAVVSDLHVRDRYSLELAERAIAMAMDERPDIIAMPGDFIDYWRPGVEELISQALVPLELKKGKVVAVFGNHEYNYNMADAERLPPILERFDIRLLRNEFWECDGVHWVGVDSACRRMARLDRLRLSPDQHPAICLWHEPDLVNLAPEGCVLQISGHSHGGQFRFPGGFTPMYSGLGKRYPRGFYRHTSPPLYVSRGVGTTGPPTRWNCPPEVSLLTLVPANI